MNGSGAGLVYRGPFVFLKDFGSSSLTLESAAFGGGRLTPRGVMFHVTDYLGSVRAVVDGTSGAVYKASDYSAFGEESVVPLMQGAAVPAGVTLRDGYTGQEDQDEDFGTSYIDFGARQYNPTLRRWMTPDPLSEKYYGVSPYAFCADNPVNFVDPDGRDTVYVFDAPNRPRDRGVYGETYTAEAYVEINGKISGPYRSSSYPNSKSSIDNSPKANTVNEGVMIDFNNQYGHKGGTQYGLNLVDELGERKVEGTNPAGDYVEMKFVNVHSGYSDNGNYNSRGSEGCITIHPDDAAAFFSNFTWSPGTFTGKSFGKIIIYRKYSPERDNHYDRILQHLNK